MTCYDETHYKAALKVLQYVKGSSRLGLLFEEGVPLKLEGYSDADHASDKLDRKSITGTLFTLGKGTVSWTSQKQKSVAISSTESEYVALSETAREGIWLRELLKELECSQDGPTPLYVDNQSAIRLAYNTELHQRTKHIEVRYHFIRERVELGDFEVVYRRTEEQPADCLTKALARPKLEVCLQLTNMLFQPVECVKTTGKSKLRCFWCECQAKARMILHPRDHKMLMRGIRRIRAMRMLMIIQTWTY